MVVTGYSYCFVIRFGPKGGIKRREHVLLLLDWRKVALGVYQQHWPCHVIDTSDRRIGVQDGSVFICRVGGIRDTTIARYVGYQAIEVVIGSIIGEVIRSG